MKVKQLMSLKQGALTIEMGLSLWKAFDKMLSFDRILKEMELCAKHQDLELEDFGKVLSKEVGKIDDEWEKPKDYSKISKGEKNI